MGLVLWIDQNTFVTALLEKVFKAQKLEFYTIASARDFSYLVDDLKPQVLVLDAPTVLQELDLFKRQYEASEALKTLPVILIEGKEELGFLANVIGKFERPFDPFQIPGKLQQILSVN